MDSARPEYDQLAAEVKRRRLALGLSINAAARLSRMSPITWTRVETGLTVRELTYAAVDRVLAWEQGSTLGMLAGNAPAPLPVEGAISEAAAPPPPRYPDDPVLQYLWELPDDDLSDDQREAVIQLYLAIKRNARQQRSVTSAPGQATPLRNTR